jgi:hypothetical protein
MLAGMAMGSHQHLDEAVQLGSLKEALQRRFAGTVPEGIIDLEVDEGLREFSGATVRTFIPVLLQTRVTERLRDLQSA